MVDEGVDVLAGRVRQEVAEHPNLFQIIDQIVYLRQAWYKTQGFGATANLFVHRKVFEALGGFDGRLRSSGDRMLCLRAAREGYRFGYHDGAIVHHCPRATARALASKEVRLGHGFGQICRFYPKSGGLRFFGQTYLPIPGIRSCLDQGAVDISPARTILALAAYSLIRVPCRTYGFLKAVCGPGAPAENEATSWVIQSMWPADNLLEEVGTGNEIRQQYNPPYSGHSRCHRLSPETSNFWRSFETNLKEFRRCISYLLYYEVILWTDIEFNNPLPRLFISFD
jgi:hypothetical protein